VEELMQLRADGAHDAMLIDLRDDFVKQAIDRGDTAALVERWADRRAGEWERHRLARVIGFALLILLNVLDIMSTAMFLERGHQEGNPLAAAMIEGGHIPWAKSIILLLLGVRVLTSRPRLATTCALWFVVGIYATVVALNLTAVWAA
jgi:hypothetical protein